MQYRMRKFQLTLEQIEELLHRANTGRFATINENGYPYVIAMHFVYYNNKIYMHGLPKGQKIDNVNRNSKVCFEVDELFGLLTDNIENACDTEAEYNSVVIIGNASLLEDLEYKREVLNRLVEKYTPQFAGKELPDNMIKGTAVIEIDIVECTGKYHK
ncbi:pyridoxamine 5'-phosphate oxidase family protein [Lachnoclostridium phytofermentans]|uniref:Pyridoxamine 5'-phosphate oxidase-related FMN-binding n=1 Tax=Lachnoclostridium phytofermentans (strain ATCC 700394 / DSM 18823 / ISDg) TaxID=357809 RepID=A9KNS3_LACP7|nr:pyridoxamine 5'-phosphate oxidase family protein [Lachnoclostridium phytofermentans]ABX41674.1 pyridoxamine 5'-phosphate oxidase-related FMN-binding [Lachnoclostridium phytofermentans ISDg]